MSSYRDMGAIIAIMGEAGDPEVPAQLERMLARSPYRGTSERHFEGGVAIAVQSLGWDASLATVGNWTTAIHGVIGNWSELASAHGWDFPDGASSAAKLAIAYENLGDSLFAKLRGEYAILIHDRRENRLIAVRDLWGRRPLFFERAGASTFIATEIRQIRAGSCTPTEIDGDVLIQALLWRPTFPTRTHLKGISRVEADRVNTFCLGQSGDPDIGPSVWSPPTKAAPTKYDFETLTEELRFLIDQAVGRWLIGVPFTLSLSGGVDSSTIWCSIANKAKSGDLNASLGRPFSFRFQNRGFDESPQIVRILEATGTTNHTFVNPTYEDSIVNLQKNAKRMDSPYYGAVSGFTDVKQKIDPRNSDLILEGMGGDLLLAGTKSYLLDILREGELVQVFLDLWILKTNPGQNRLEFIWSKTAAPLARRIRSVFRGQRTPNKFPDWIHPSRHEVFDAERPTQWLPGGFAPRYQHQKSILNSINIYQGLCGAEGAEQLRSADGLTLGSPLIDIDIVNFAYCAPPRSFSNGKRYKQLLRNVYYDHLGDAVRRWRNPQPAFALTSVETESLARLYSPHSWKLADLNIVDPMALKKLFLTSPNDLVAGCFLGELAIAEAVIRELH